MTPTQALTLATGAKLDADTWADFANRLRHHCRGEGVEWHSTACALFTVQRRVYVYGIDLDYAGNRCLIDHDGDTRAWRDIASCLADLDDDERALIDKQVASDYGPDATLAGLHEHTQFEVIADVLDYTLTGWDERWEFVGAHFTKEAAEAFIKRKGHDYRDGLRVYVGAQPYAWEFEAIKDGIMAGRIGWIAPGAAPAAPAGEPVAPPMLQAGMSNADIEAAWSRKLPGQVPQGQELSAFALGIEVGAERYAETWDALRQAIKNYQDMSSKKDRATAAMYQFHYAMKDAGWHPGRTDDSLCDVIRAKGKELQELRTRLDAAPAPAEPAPEGWRLVPVEPTPEMLDAANRARLYREHGSLDDQDVAQRRTYNSQQAWAAMLAAVPASPKG